MIANTPSYRGQLPADADADADAAIRKLYSCHARALHGYVERDVSPDMQPVEWSGTHGKLLLNWGQCTMQASPGTLALRAEAADQENLTRIQELVTARLERFGRREQLEVIWHQVPEPVDQDGASRPA